MKTITLLICTFLLSTINPIHAQEYLNLKQDEVIYDVDVIVFARQLAQPEKDTIKSKSSIKTDDVLTLMPWDKETPLMQYPQITDRPENADENWQVPIEEQALPVQVLSWIVLSNSMNHPMINKLETNPALKPLYRQKWRQPATSFTDPQYVEISNSPIIMDDQFNPAFGGENTSQVTELKDDYSIDGQMAFSKQRFTHLHLKMNLYRQNINAEQIVYEISQQKRVELDEWQYFDHQQFGVIAKVTAVSLKEENE